MTNEIDEIARKTPSALNATKRALEITFMVMEEKRKVGKEGCTLLELLNHEKTKKAGVRCHEITDAVAALMLAGKATYAGDRSKTVVKANKDLERLIIGSLYGNKDGRTIEDLQKEADRKGISADEFHKVLITESVRNRVVHEDGKILGVVQRPPDEIQPWQRPEPGSDWERYYEESTPTTYGQEEFAKDHERIVYSSEFRRLAGVTQVFGTSEGHVFHNRLTHTIKAAQIARSIALRLDRTQQIRPDVVEAAALAHDLGHPPFGHAGEAKLESLLSAHSVHDGYEGNAQNLRIVTQLSRVRREFRGLNLTRATLNALMKYPWLRGDQDKKAKKWNTYSTESRFFQFARSRMTGKKAEEKSDEAKVMEWADDIAYGVHDIEDGVRAGMIPLSELLNDQGERDRFLEGSKSLVER